MEEVGVEGRLQRAEEVEGHYLKVQDGEEGEEDQQSEAGAGAGAGQVQC